MLSTLLKLTHEEITNRLCLNDPCIVKVKFRTNDALSGFFYKYFGKMITNSTLDMFTTTNCGKFMINSECPLTTTTKNAMTMIGTVVANCIRSCHKMDIEFSECFIKGIFTPSDITTNETKQQLC